MAVNFDVDFRPLSEIAKSYQDAKQRQQLQEGLQQMGLPGNMNLAQLAIQQRLTSPEYITQIETAKAKVAEQFAPKTANIKLPGGEEVTATKGPNGFELPQISGMPAPDPNAPQPPPGVDAKKWREARATQLANVDDKAIQEADKAVQASTQAVESLNKAIALSKKAVYGPGASKIGYAASLAPDYFSNVKAAGVATEELSSTVTSQALENLRATFGGNPTEGERKILMDVQGAVNQAPEVREKIYQNAIEAANKRIEFNKRTAEQMRGGRYLLPEAQRNAPQSGGSVKPPVAGARQAPDGNYYVPDPSRPGKFLKVTP
jgi:hypothetical protein